MGFVSDHFGWPSKRIEKTPKQKVRTVEVICTVNGGSSYRVRGKRQVPGDLVRLSLGDAEDLVRRGKAKIIEGSERVELQ